MTCCIFSVVVLVLPAIVFAREIWASVRKSRGIQFDKADYLTLATVPSSVAIILSLRAAVPTRTLLWITFVYLTMGLICTLSAVWRKRENSGARQDWEMAFCLLYFGILWLAYAYGLVIGVVML